MPGTSDNNVQPAAKAAVFKVNDYLYHLVHKTYLNVLSAKKNLMGELSTWRGDVQNGG